MALHDRLETTPRRHSGRPCSVGELEDKLTGTEADAFFAMLHTLGWSARRVHDALESEGIKTVALQTINRHRSRACRCYKAAA